MAAASLPPLDLRSATVLITGGSTGIGRGLAQRFLSAGSTVIITGRKAETLEIAKAKHPGLQTLQNDVSTPEEREKLAAVCAQQFPALNVLVNNAGMQRTTVLAEEKEWAPRQLEIATNLEAPVHLASLFTPLLLKQSEAAIVNVTSGLAFIPCAFAPMYGATKAALHSFTVAMRPHYANTNIRIVELVPPPVKTNLPSSQSYGEDCDEFCDHVFARFAAGEQEIGYKLSEEARKESREQIDKRFAGMTSRAFKGPTF